MSTVLFVDDVPAITSALKRRLRQEPFRMLEARSAHDALDVVAREPVDVIVSDEVMPGMSGTELLRHLYRTRPDIVGIVLTGQPSVDAAVRAINEGHVYRFLTKPCDPLDLAAAIREALRDRDVLVETRKRMRERAAEVA
jgi:DNA-binding NtrC family response regulator